MNLLAQQFKLPQGILGRWVGWFMARQNSRLNRTAIRELQVSSGDVILEIGFGPGTAIQLINKRHPVCKVFGIDPSETMLREASNINRSGIDAGTITLSKGQAENLPFTENQFSKVFSVSTFHDWADPMAALIEIRRVLKKDGYIFLCLRRAPQTRWPWSSPGLSPMEIEQDLSLMRHAGFKNAVVKKQRWSRHLIFSGVK